MLIGSKAIGTVAYLGGVPAILEEFTFSLAQLLIYSRESLCTDKQYIHLDRVKYSDHAPARNALASRFLGDWILFLDTDHMPEPDLLVRMLDRLEYVPCDVLTGVYRFKSPPCSPVLYVKNPEGVLQPVATYPQGLFRVHAAGAGCLLISRKVFDRILNELGEQPFDRYPGLSEDHSFFRRLEKLDIPVWCDGRIDCYHLRTTPVTMSEDSDYTVGEPFAVEGILQ